MIGVLNAVVLARAAIFAITSHLFELKLVHWAKMGKMQVALN